LDELFNLSRTAHEQLRGVEHYLTHVRCIHISLCVSCSFSCHPAPNTNFTLERAMGTMMLARLAKSLRAIECSCISLSLFGSLSVEPRNALQTALVRMIRRNASTLQRCVGLEFISAQLALAECIELR
jgi:hypothetical protein